MGGASSHGGDGRPTGWRCRRPPRPASGPARRWLRSRLRRPLPGQGPPHGPGARPAPVSPTQDEALMTGLQLRAQKAGRQLQPRARRPPSGVPAAVDRPSQRPSTRSRRLERRGPTKRQLVAAARESKPVGREAGRVRGPQDSLWRAQRNRRRSAGRRRSESRVPRGAAQFRNYGRRLCRGRARRRQPSRAAGPVVAGAVAGWHGTGSLPPASGGDRQPASSRLLGLVALAPVSSVHQGSKASLQRSPRT